MNSEPEQKQWQMQDSSPGSAQANLHTDQIKASTPAKPDAWIGKTLGNKYVVLEVLGKGGMGTVYKARHLSLNTIVAVKVLNVIQSAERDKQLRRFDIEAKAASKVRHPNLISVTDYGLADDDAPYLVMDFVVGDSLGAELEERGRLNPIRAMRIFMQICEGMEAAHNEGIIHRDLKPSNIILEKDGNGEDLVRIVDFGIAKIAVEDNEAAPKLTQTGEIFGSPLYMSPEQCMGYKLDKRSDVYSLGCLMYETLSGSPPFVGANAVKTIFKHINDAPAHDPLEQLRVPPALISVLLETLEKKPENRPESMEALRKELVHVISGKIVAKPRAPRASTAPSVSPPANIAASSGKNSASRVGMIIAISAGLILVFFGICWQVISVVNTPTGDQMNTPTVRQPGKAAPTPVGQSPQTEMTGNGQQVLTGQYPQPTPPQLQSTPLQQPQFALPVMRQLTQMNGPAQTSRTGHVPVLPGMPGYRYGFSFGDNLDAQRRGMEATVTQH